MTRLCRSVLSACALLLCLLPGAVAQESVIAGLSQHNVSLTTGFAGSEIFVYGAIRQTAAAPIPDQPLDIIVAITGPSSPVIVRKKQRRLGIWVNGEGVEVDGAPSFYAVASTRDLRDTLSWTDDLRYRIGLDSVIRIVDAPEWVEDRESYRLAVARIREDEGLYSLRPGTVKLVEDTLFETRVKLPANLIEGDYLARVFLIRDKAVIDVYTDKIEVRRAGIGRWIYTAAQDYPAYYGIGSIVIALIAGWLASAFFRTFFPI